MVDQDSDTLIPSNFVNAVEIIVDDVQAQPETTLYIRILTSNKAKRANSPTLVIFNSCASDYILGVSFSTFSSHFDTNLE